MYFTENKIKKLQSGDFGDIYQGISHNFYDVKPLLLGEKEKVFADFLVIEIQKGASSRKAFEGVRPEFFEEFYEKIVSVVELNGLNSNLPSRPLFLSILESMIKLVSSVDFIKDKAFFSEYVLHNAIGLKQIYFFSLDDDLEELMVNGASNIFVFHKKHGMCKTNIVLSEKDLANLIHKIASTIGKDFSSNSPLLDARLPDGSRVNATIGDLSPMGPSLTIRKFAPIPLTILDLIENGTIPSDAAAFLWFMVDGLGEYPKNILVAGGTASGKTTLLNILSNFIRPNERIVSIEDTVELSLFARENWVALEARSTGPDTTMDALLKNAMRMRPDRIIVGEVRGPEALTLFTAMDTGHQGCLGTIHANNARETLVKLQERPLLVPESMLPLLDFIIIMERHYSKTRGMQRFVTKIVELSRMDTKTLQGVLFDFDEKRGVLYRTDLQSRVIEEIAQHSGVMKNDLKKELEVRRRVLEWMIRQGIRKPLEVIEVIESYYFDPEKVLATMSQVSDSTLESGEQE